MTGTPSDWVSGERVFAPPSGTLDVDWLVPAVVEAVPGMSAAQARAALERAWRRHRADPPGEPGTSTLDVAAEAVVAEALRSFRA